MLGHGGPHPAEPWIRQQPPSTLSEPALYTSVVPLPWLWAQAEGCEENLVDMNLFSPQDCNPGVKSDVMNSDLELAPTLLPPFAKWVNDLVPVSLCQNGN